MSRPLLPRLVTFALLAPAGVVFAATRALGAPGGGTDDFGGGGGSSGGGGGYSGGGSSSGGGGFSSGGSSRRSNYSGGGSSSSGGGDAGAVWFLVLIIVVAVIAYYSYTYKQKQVMAFDGGPDPYRGSSAKRPSRIRKRGASRAERSQREQEVSVAAEDAVMDDPVFAPDAVKAAAVELHRQITEAWTGRDRDALAKLISPSLHTEWCRRLDDFDRKGWHNITEILAPPGVEYLGMKNKPGDEHDTVTVRIEAELKDYVLDSHGTEIDRKDEIHKHTLLAEYWTLAKQPGGSWVLVSIEQDAEGTHFISDPIISSPVGDDVGIRDEAVTEQAVARAVPDSEIAGIADVDLEGSARTAALDLASTDGRFDPDVLEAAARRAVGAWVEAVDGADEPLAAVASPDAVKALLYPSKTSDKYRVVVRGGKVKEVRITRVDAAATPATMTVEVDVTGRRYLQDRDSTAVVEGDPDKESTFTERWTMALDGADSTPWRLVGTR